MQTDRPRRKPSFIILQTMSRWGSKVSGSGGGNPPPAPSGGGGGGVSDDAALAALLASAEQRQAEKAPPKKKASHAQNRHKTTGSNGGGGAGGGGGEKRDYYGPSGGSGGGGNSADGQHCKRQRRWGGKSKEEPIPDLAWGTGAAKTTSEGGAEQGDEAKQQEKKKADFGLSGALASDERTGNVYNGILLKFSEPPEARAPNTRWRLYVFRKKEGDAVKSGSADDGELIETLHVSRQSAYLFGREAKVADIPVLHPSLSSQHCVLQYRATPDASIGGRLRCRPYLMDLDSTNGTFVNCVRLESARYYELRKGDVITLGASTREYVLLTENSTEAGTGVGA